MPNFGSAAIPEEVYSKILRCLPRECLPLFSYVSKEWNAHIAPMLYERIDLVWRRKKVLCRHDVRDMYRGREHPSPCPCEHNSRCEQENHPLQTYTSHKLPSCLVQVSSEALESYPSIYLLARTLIHSPEYAGFVRSLRLLGPVPKSVWIDHRQTSLTNKDRERIRQILSENVPTECSEDVWIAELDKGSPSAFAALLLIYLKRLVYVEIGAEFNQVSSFMGAPSVKGSKALIQASYGSFRDEVYMTPGRRPLAICDNPESLLLFYLPNVRCLSLNIPKLCKFRWPVRGTAPLAESLESLELAFTFLGERDLAHLLKACPRLRHLKYDLWITLDQKTEPLNRALVDLCDLGQTLAYVKPTLETFHLHIGKHHWSSGVWMDYWNHIAGHISFADFPRLTHLHVPLQVLIGDETANIDIKTSLPKALTDLWVNLDGFDFPAEDEPGSPPEYTDLQIIPIFSNLLSHWHTCTPSLKTIKLIVYQVSRLVWDQWDPDDLTDALVPNGHDAGVDVTVDAVLYRKESRTSPDYILLRQLTPYFSQDVIDKYRVSHKGANARHPDEFIPTDE